MMFAVKREVLEKLLANSKWTRQLEKCRSTKEVEGVLERFCMENGFKVKMVKEVKNIG